MAVLPVEVGDGELFRLRSVLERGFVDWWSCRLPRHDFQVSQVSRDGTRMEKDGEIATAQQSALMIEFRAAQGREGDGARIVER